MHRNRSLQILVFIFWAIPFLGAAQQLKDSIEPMPTKLIQPPYLQKGDTVMIVAPAGILKNREDVIGKAKALAESWGLYVKYGEHLFNQNHHFAGTDEERISDMQKAIDDPAVKAIWAARGGYGSVRIIDQLDFSALEEHPKWIIGYSDITAFHNHLNGLGYESLHAMMGTSMDFDPEETKESKETLRKALFGESLAYHIAPSPYNKLGSAEGVLVGGNLTLLLTMLGSESQLDTEGKILFIEEIGEYKYHIDRILQSLKRAGYFEQLKGVIVGDMSNIKKNTTIWGSTTEQLILDAFKAYNFPVLFNFPAGHENDNRALIMGRTIQLNITPTTGEVIFK